jgi:hypothetical protein
MSPLVNLLRLRPEVHHAVACLFKLSEASDASNYTIAKVSIAGTKYC